MQFIFTLVVYYVTGGHDRVGFATLDGAMNAYDNLDGVVLGNTHIEAQYGDTYWEINAGNGKFRRSEDTPV